MTASPPRLHFRPFSTADCGWLQPITADPRVTRYASWGPNTPADTLAFLEQSEQAGRGPGTFRWAITLADGTGIGSAELEITDRANRRASVGYMLGTPHWGRGYATEVARELVAFAWTQGVHRVEATCHPENTASARVLEKAGLALEGRLRDHLLVRGAWRDSLLFARIVRD